MEHFADYRGDLLDFFFYRHIMSPMRSEDGQRRDELLRRLAKMPPKTQAELKRDLAAARKLTRVRVKRASAGKRAPSV